MDATDAGRQTGDFTAVVASNRQIGDTVWKLRLEFTGEGEEAFRAFRPGQFVQLDATGAPLPPVDRIPPELRDAAERQVILRRPFSFTDLEAQKRKTIGEILYCVLGPVTLRMTMLKPGVQVPVIGPLGNGFWVPEGKQTALLVVGGMGTAPLQHLAQRLAHHHKDIETTAFAGARTSRALPFEHKKDEISQGLGFALSEFSRFGIESYIATDDGSAGYHGFVTDRLLQWMDEHQPKSDTTIIYTCGPEVMLDTVARIAAERGIDCQVSMERRMACGIGLCQSCAVECRVEGSDETVYKMCCQEGPVFDAREVVFDLREPEVEQAAEVAQQPQDDVAVAEDSEGDAPATENTEPAESPAEGDPAAVGPEGDIPAAEDAEHPDVSPADEASDATESPQVHIALTQDSDDNVLTTENTEDTEKEEHE